MNKGDAQVLSQRIRGRGGAHGVPGRVGRRGLQRGADALERHGLPHAARQSVHEKHALRDAAQRKIQQHLRFQPGVVQERIRPPQQPPEQARGGHDPHSRRHAPRGGRGDLRPGAEHHGRPQACQPEQRLAGKLSAHRQAILRSFAATGMSATGNISGGARASS